MPRPCHISTIIYVALSVLGTTGNVPAHAGDRAERRSYDIRVDGKPAGQYELVLTDLADGTDVQSRCDIDFPVLFIHYRYRYRGHEAWKQNRLDAFQSDSSDAGKRCQINMQTSQGKRQLTVNGKPRPMPDSALPSSYWFTPGDQTYNGQFLEVDTGRIFPATFTLTGNETLQIAGQPQQCKHYHETGGDPGELWYDQKNRLVRQTFSSEGHSTEVVLKSATR